MKKTLGAIFNELRDFDLLSNASLPVQIILLILVVASVLSWVLIFEKFFTLSKATKNSHEIEDQFWEGESVEKLYIDLKEKDLIFDI